MSLNKGDRVIATKDIGGFFTDVRKGTEGVVTAVEGGAVFKARYQISFSNGANVQCDDSQVARI